MFNCGTDLTEQSLNQIYDVISKEQMNHMNTIKTSKELDEKREKSIQKQLSLLNTIMISILRLRNIQKKETQS